MLAISRMDGMFQCFVNTNVLFLIIEHNILGLLITKLTNNTQGNEIFAVHTPKFSSHFFGLHQIQIQTGCWSAMKTITFEKLAFQGDQYK